MKKQRGVASPMITRPMFSAQSLATDFIKDLMDYLKLKLVFLGKINEKDTWTCRCTENNYWDYNHWKHTQDFCRNKGLDWLVMREIIEDIADNGFRCEADILNEVDITKIPIKRDISSPCQKQDKVCENLF